MKKNSKVKVRDNFDSESLEYWKLDPNEIYVIKKTYFYNGEHYALMTNGKEWPLVYFVEIKGK